VTGGITFTFGGVKVNSDAPVISTGWRPIKGLYAAGEMVGGLFHYNYALGSGRIAGRAAARS
jgi:tricarballylate dehydrogenase